MKRIISILLVLCAVFVSGIASSAAIIIDSPDYYTRTDEAHLPFEDVKEGHWFFDSVEFCYVNCIVNGMNPYTFGHSQSLSRAQFVTMLANVEAIDTSLYSVDKFSDVTPTNWFYGAVAWAYSEGFVSGKSENSFAPNSPITREELSRIMYLYMKDSYTVEVDTNCLDGFADSDNISEWAIEGMKYVVSAGLISGMQMNGELSVAPRNLTTRAQTAVVMKHFSEGYFFGYCEHSITEATCVDQPLCSKCGMRTGLANGHKVAKGLYNCITQDSCLICRESSGKSEYVHLFGKANCNIPRTCALCGITRGTTVGEHQWWAATCTVPKMCKVCYKTEGSSLGGHQYKAATCIAPKECTRCGVTEGKIPGHSYGTNNKCIRCGLESPYDKMVYAIKTKGSYDNGEGVYRYTLYSAADTAAYIVYDTVTEKLQLIYKGNYAAGDYDYTVVTLSSTAFTSKVDYYWYGKDGRDLYIKARLDVDNTTFSSKTVLDLDHHFSGYVSNKSVAAQRITYQLDFLLKKADPVFSRLCGSDVCLFGFLNY